MILIDERAVVSCFVDAAAILVMVLLLFLSERLRRRKTLSLNIFFALCRQILFMCLICLVSNAMYRQPAPWCRTVALICQTLLGCSILVLDCMWLAYVDVKLYGERKQWTLARLCLVLPLVVFLILLVVNLFTGIVFTMAEDNSVQPKPLFYVMMLLMFLYFSASALFVWYFDRRSSKIRFLHVEPMIISMLAALITQFFSPYDTGILGFVVGITLLYFSMADEFRFLDEESQLYNRRFLSIFFERAATGKNAARSALILEADGDLPSGFEILRDTLHREGDVIRLEDRKFLMFSTADNRTELQLLSTRVEEAVEKHNTEHPEEKVRMAVRCRMRMEEEDPYTFLREVVEEKEAGDTIHGVVSMISELGRLDKELALAADIQSSMLPTVFPPFPERTEFDLFASMTPAKEVGGDFYDFFLIDSDHLALVIADVSGKGIPAALFMMTSKTLIKNQLLSGSDPASAMERVNLQLCEHNSSRMFVTVWLAVVELSTGRVLACNAGHEHPAFRRSGGDFELVKYKHGIFAGVSKKAKYQNRELELHPGDCIFVYTDGVPEANNALEEMFGENQLTETLNQDPDALPDALIRRMHDAVDRFAGGADQFDDITMLCMKYYGNQDEKEEMTT